MKTSSSRPGKPGFVSYVLVLTSGAFLTMLMVFTYRQAMAAQAVQSQVQLRNDYSEKEDAILRSIVTITPNRAIRAMQSGSGSATAISNPLRWRNIFDESLALSNARTSISPELLAKLGVTNAKQGNSGDSSLADAYRIFHPIGVSNNNTDARFATSGINNDLGTGFPVPLKTENSQTSLRDTAYPIISNDKLYGTQAQSGVGLDVTTYPKFNLLKYPQINFGYAKPGDDFVAKRNWWAFTMDLSDHDDDTTKSAKVPRDFVLSIYEIPSQLAISASSFLSFGEYASGEAWQNVTIQGGVYAGKAEVEGETALNALASRRGMDLSDDAVIGGKSFANSPFAPGVREAYQVTEGEFFPVSLASESGRVAFIPINRGADFFDRFAHAAETNTVSTTTWNNYSVGALQCAMSLDITSIDATTKQPTEFRFRAQPNIDFRQPLVTGIPGLLPPGYVLRAQENESYNFGSDVVDIAYGKNGVFYFQLGVTGNVTFNNARFGDPVVGTFKSGYSRPSAPFKITPLPSGERTCVEIMPQRIAAFLQNIGASNTSINHSIVVNVDYTTSGLNNPNFNPIKNGQYVEILPGNIPNYGLILRECSDFTTFPKGFSLVSNLRTYIGDDFNVVAYSTAPPASYVPPADGYFPPCSVFVPDKRYGLEMDPYAVNVKGQMGSLASEDAANPTRPLDSKAVSGNAFSADRITVNLRPITHPAELPPVTMMNWLVMIEERRQ